MNDVKKKNSEGTDSDKPIMDLFKRLINNDFNQTNAQIFELLKKEFNMNMNTMHKLEIEMYLCIMKKFLKEWPSWDEFDIWFNNPNHASNKSYVDKILGKYYTSLKKYIQEILTLAKPLVEEAVQKVKHESVSVSDAVDVVLEVICSRAQLNQLVRRYPDNSDCIFANINVVPKNIIVLPLSSILEWYQVSVHIVLKNFRFTFSANHKLTHFLVNKKCEDVQRKTVPANDMEILIQNANKSKNYHKRNLFGVLRELIKLSDNNNILIGIYKALEEDLKDVEIMKFPGTYKKNITKYPYRRYLHTEVGNPRNERNIDCQLEETIVPIHEFFVSTITVDLQKSTFDWFRVECGQCKVKFQGLNCEESLKQHFAECHNSETDWHCTNCSESFKVVELSSKRWQHTCNETSFNPSTLYS